MLWSIMKFLGALYAVLFVLGVPLLLAMCKASGEISRREEYDDFERWRLKQETLEREAYRH